MACDGVEPIGMNPNGVLGLVIPLANDTLGPLAISIGIGIGIGVCIGVYELAYALVLRCM